MPVPDGVAEVVQPGPDLLDDRWVAAKHDVLSSLGTRSRRQRLVGSGLRLLDRHDCTDGRMLHFDATPLLLGSA